MKAIICGGRTYAFTAEDIAWLDKLDAQHGFKLVIEGGCRRREPGTGKMLPTADWEAYLWAVSRDIPTETIPADWDRYERAAGPIRNEIMAGLGDICIAFPGGRGTANMVIQAKARGLRIITHQ